MNFFSKLHIAALLAFGLTSSPWAQVVTVVTEEYPPYNFQDPSSKQIMGMSTEVVLEVFKRAKVEVKLDMFPWARAYQMAQDSPNVLIYSIGRNTQRENLFKWVGVIAPYDVYMYRLKSRSDIRAESLDEAKKFKIGAVRDDVRAQALERAGIAAELVAADGLNVKTRAMERLTKFAPSM